MMKLCTQSKPLSRQGHSCLDALPDVTEQTPRQGRPAQMRTEGRMAHEGQNTCFMREEGHLLNALPLDADLCTLALQPGGGDEALDLGAPHMLLAILLLGGGVGADILAHIILLAQAEQLADLGRPLGSPLAWLLLIRQTWQLCLACTPAQSGLRAIAGVLLALRLLAANQTCWSCLPCTRMGIAAALLFLQGNEDPLNMEQDQAAKVTAKQAGVRR